MTAEREALAELVACNDLKKQADYNLLYAQTTGSLELGKKLTEEYRHRKVAAWAAARAALAAPAQGGPQASDADGPDAPVGWVQGWKLERAHESKRAAMAECEKLRADAERMRQLFVKWWMKDIDNCCYFNEAVRDPILAARITAAINAAQEPQRHLTRDEQAMLGRALRASAREVTAQEPPAAQGEPREEPTWGTRAWAAWKAERDADAIAALRAENERQAREIAEWRTWGTIEVAIRNPNVASSMNHWEQRAERAEAECEKLREEFGNLAAILRVNILRLEPKATHAEIDAMLHAAREGK